MPLPLLVIPIALAGGCAAIQAATKIRAHRKLTQLHQELESARQEHVQLMQYHYERQQELCAQLGLPEPGLPDALLPQPEPEPERRRWARIRSRLPFRKNAALLEQAPSGSSATIVGRHGAGFAASTVWKTSSAQILRIVQPMSARMVSFAPKFAGFASTGGGATGSIAASTGLRFALSAFSIAGIVIGPALAAWCVYSEYRKVRKAKAELAAVLDMFRTDLDDMSHETGKLEALAAAEERPALQQT